MAYAALISLKHHIESLMDPNIAPYQICFTIATINELLLITQAFDNKDSSQRFDIGAIKALDAKIRGMAWELEDALESYALHLSLPPADNNGCLQMGNLDMEEEICKFRGMMGYIRYDFDHLLHHPLVGEDEDDDEDGIPDFGGNKSTTVRLSEGQFKEINMELVDAQRGLKVVSLVGMAGIGKTHFAREIIQHPQIVQYFDCVAWVRVGQKGRVKNIIADIIAQIERKPRSKSIYLNKNMYTLGMLLRQVVDGQECLIVLDDVWSEGVCYDIICRLQEAGARRVLLTTRLGHINEYNKQGKIYRMRFLSNEESWNLLWQNVFVGESSFPPQLEKVGRKIAANCEGLPLLILVVAHLLCGVDKTEEYWQMVADKKTSTFDDAYDKISSVLFSSYEYLPEELKACFLYMGVFPQTCEIPLSKLIHLWGVEVLLEPNLAGKFVESLEKLVSNSLVIICKVDYRRRMKSLKLHSAYWYVCVKEARKTKFLHVLNKLTDGAQEDIQGQRRLSVQNSILFGINEVHDSMAEASPTRSLLCTGKDQQYPVPICFNLMFLRVLDALSIRLYEFPDEVVKLFLLRYLALTYNGKLPSSISYLRHLQFLIVCQHHNIKLLSDSHSTCLPKEIWDMRQLKHLRIRGYNISDPRYGALPLPNLEKLYVNAHSCNEAVYAKLPKLKKLRISIELEPSAAETSSCLEHIGLLDELESLKCVVVNPCLKPQAVPRPEDLSNLPKGLKKLSLNGLGYSWDYIRTISNLPSLEVLKLRCSAFEGLEWCLRSGDFSSLEFLLLEDINLVHWRMFGSYCFRQLQRLTLRQCFKLKAMPWDFKHDEYLKTVEVEIVDCSPSVVASAKELNSTSSRQIMIDSSWSL